MSEQIPPEADALALLRDMHMLPNGDDDQETETDPENREAKDDETSVA